MKILLTDCFTRKSFDIYNILCLNFNPSDIILINSNRSNIKGFFIYGSSPIILRKTQIDIFESDLLKISNLYSNEIIIYLPIEEDTTKLFYSFIKHYGSLNFVYCLSDEEIYHLVSDKYLLNNFCLQNNIPAPKIYDNEQLLKLNREKFNPLIVKPRNGSGSKGIIHIDNPEQLTLLKNLHLQYYVIQEKIEKGKDVKGAFFLCSNGNVISCYCHERIRTFPIEGGVTVYSKISSDKKVVEIGSKLLKILNWSGFAMIEFLWDQNQNTFKVIEINPRLWGSVLLSEFAGTHILTNYINLCENKPLQVSKINYNTKIRWIPFDLVNFIKAKGKINSFWKLDKKNTCYINLTYGRWHSNIWFHLFYYFNVKNFKNFLKKW